jgi:hypothetical protein
MYIYVPFFFLFCANLTFRFKTILRWKRFCYVRRPDIWATYIPPTANITLNEECFQLTGVEADCIQLWYKFVFQTSLSLNKKCFWDFWSRDTDYANRFPRESRSRI